MPGSKRRTRAASRPTVAVSWGWVAVVSATAVGSAYALHGFFRAASLAASTFAVFTLLRRLRVGAADRPPGDG